MRHYWNESFDPQDLNDFRTSSQQSISEQERNVQQLKISAEAAKQEKEQKTAEAKEAFQNVRETEKQLASASEAEKEAVQTELAAAQDKAEIAKQEALSASEKDEVAQHKLETAQAELKEDKKLLNDASEWMGDTYGDRFCTEVLGYEPVLEKDSKAHRQGFDGVYRDPKNGDLVVVEFKGQNSQPSKLQKDINWSSNVAERTLDGKGNYLRASEFEKETAALVKDAYEKGELRYEVVRTKVDKDGSLVTEQEKSTRPQASAETRSEESEQSFIQPKSDGNAEAAAHMYGLSIDRQQTNTQSHTETSESRQG